METHRLTPTRGAIALWQAPGAPRVWALPTPPGAPRDTVRALARAALADLLGVPTLTNQRGEPPRAPARPDLHLSLSHAEGLSLLACHGAPVGVDVQHCPCRPTPPFSWRFSWGQIGFQRNPVKRKRLIFQ